MDQSYPASLPWSLTKKILFRASFFFFAFYIFFTPNGFLPGADFIHDFYIQPFHIFIPWVGRHILHLSYPITSFTDGSGDTTYDYLILLLILVLTLLGTLIWTLTDKRRNDYNTLYYWLTVLIRYYCAFNMFGYGFSKIYMLQFTFPSQGSLLQPLGTYSPMHLAWSFFGYSRGYNYFIGLSEVLSGLLLLSRRTTRLGAVLLLVITANIMAINYSFDVCVKLLSTMLFAMPLFLLLQERRRLIDFFIRNQPTAPETEYSPRFKKRWITLSLITLKYALILTTLVGANYDMIDRQRQYGPNVQRPPLYGIYDIQTFAVNKDTLAPSLTDTTRWRRLIITNKGAASVRMMNDSAVRYIFKPDTLSKKIELYPTADSTKKSYLRWSFTGPDSLRLYGSSWRGDSLTIILKRYDNEKFILVNRGFHLINETPYQR